MEAKLNQAGFSTVRFRQQVPAKLFSVVIASLKDPEEAQAVVERLQKDGYGSGVLLVGRNGVTVRVGAATPLRTAVQVAEKLRAACAAIEDDLRASPFVSDFREPHVWITGYFEGMHLKASAWLRHGMDRRDAQRELLLAIRARFDALVGR